MASDASWLAVGFVVRPGGDELKASSQPAAAVPSGPRRAALWGFAPGRKLVREAAAEAAPAGRGGCGRVAVDGARKTPSDG